MIRTYSPLEYKLDAWIKDSKESTFANADVVLIPGGSDVNPALYGHSKLPTTQVNDEADHEEMRLISRAIEDNKFIVGICKGSQMLTAAAGGWLIQDVGGHHGLHDMQTYEGQSILVNSSHHQMSYPYDLPVGDYELLGWSGESHYYTMQGNEDIDNHPGAFNHCNEMGRFKEPEAIWYPKIRGLALQFHPEWNDCPTEAINWANQQVLRLL